MSRIGKKPVQLPSEVTVELKDGVVTVTGPKGSLAQKLPPDISVVVENSVANVTIERESKRARAFQGLARSLLANMVTGVSTGISKGLEIIGIGYRAEIDGRVLVLNLGYSHPVRYQLPEGITAEIEKNTLITIRGIDKRLIGQVAAEIRRVRGAEPYKGKGIRYAGEQIKRKAGKSGK